MNIELQISDEVYKNLLSKGSRVSGTIALVSPKEGNFNAWKSHQVLLIIYTQFTCDIK